MAGTVGGYTVGELLRLKAKRVAQAGDICVLLEPVEHEITEIEVRQRTLQGAFGGDLHLPVHYTCQRFSVSGDEQLQRFITQWVLVLQQTDPFPIVAEGLIQLNSPFWLRRLLRWQIQLSDPILNFVEMLEHVLIKVGIQPDFPLHETWRPNRVTALEYIPEIDLDDSQQRFGLPYHLFITVTDCVQSGV